MSCASCANSDRLNLKPSVWGKHLWFSLYSIALGYPNTPKDEDKAAIRSLMQNLVTLIPCEACRSNLKTELETCPITDEMLLDSDSVTHYIYDLQQKVSTRLGKTTPSYTAVIRTVLSQQSRLCGTQSRDVFIGVLLFIIILLTVLVCVK